MAERQLQEFFIKKCRQAGLLAYKMVCVGRRGFPDVMVVAPDGRVMFVELKHPNGKGKLSVQQEKIIGELRSYQQNVKTIHTKDEVIEIIDTLLVPHR